LATRACEAHRDGRGVTSEEPVLPRPGKPVSSSIRARLRAATAEAHERMHAHPGFAAAAAGAIGIADYRQLLARVYGFHRPFELAAREAVASSGMDFDVEQRARSPALLADLKSLGLRSDAIARLPLWAPRESFGSVGAILGAFYVLEGSTLGGVQIARALRGVVGDDSGDGIRFFLGRGDRQGEMWIKFVRKLESLSGDPDDCEDAVRAAVATFEDFEAWMNGWTMPPACVAPL
jgi:heme oxygenase (biliverdin-IX-beta and delta-forming)